MHLRCALHETLQTKSSGVSVRFAPTRIRPNGARRLRPMATPRETSRGERAPHPDTPQRGPPFTAHGNAVGNRPLETGAPIRIRPNGARR